MGAKEMNSFKYNVKFRLKHSFKDKKGLNAVVLEGLEEMELKEIKGFEFIQPDLLLYTNADSWGLSRITFDEQYPYDPVFKGCGVNVYVIDTGKFFLNLSIKYF